MLTSCKRDAFRPVKESTNQADSVEKEIAKTHKNSPGRMQERTGVRVSTQRNTEIPKLQKVPEKKKARTHEPQKKRGG
ncbi:MAG: hypothetical protein K0R29_1705 [Pseudobdellovibrio sp.]|jgi:hypothetical protein|nr:hypothetical protein [Pseudobdellovibrio sp.]